jgi:hypothetical protein
MHPMQVDELWSVIAAARTDGGDASDVAERIRQQLCSRPAAEIYRYLEQQAAVMEQSYSWALWGAAYVANGGCSDDGFDYFRGWLLAQGRDVFERALQDPDSLADLIHEQEQAECEDMIAVAAQAYKDVTGDYPEGPPVMLPELGPSWDFDDEDEMKQRYPRLRAKLYGDAED